MPSMLTDIVAQMSDDVNGRLALLLRGDAAATERAIDASLPAIIAALGAHAETDAPRVFDAISTYGHVGDDASADDVLAGGEAIADVAFGDSVQRVTDRVAAHIDMNPVDVAAMMGGLAGVVGSYLARRVTSDALDAPGLASLLEAERQEMSAIGLGPLLADWGLGGPEGVVAPEDAEEEIGFQYDDTSGRPGALWLLTGLVTVILFAIAIGQCSTG